MTSSPGRLVVILSVVMFVGGVVVLIVGIVLGVQATRNTNSAPCVLQDQLVTTTPVPTTKLPGPTPSPSIEGHYRYAAVASDNVLCSKIGTEIMGRKGGSVVDAAIATMLCAGSVIIESNGIGGGHFMTIYKRAANKTHAIMAREQAPASATQDMFIGLTGYNNSLEGGLSVAIPGEIMGIWEAYKIGGSLPWKELFEPAIKLCEEGFPVAPSTIAAIKTISNSGYMDRHPGLRELVTNPATKKYYKLGETMKRPTYARTLRTIASEGYSAFYNGSLSATIAKEIRDAGGIITEDDLKSHFAVVKTPPMLKLNNNMRIFSPPPPSGGVVLQYILNILSGYNFTPYDLMTHANTVMTYHRITEAFKFAFAKRTAMGDDDVEDQTFKDNIAELVRNLTSRDYGDDVRSKVNDEKTQSPIYYGPVFDIPEDAGTGHISVLAPNGDAVSLTTTINRLFGSKIVGAETGIVYNDEMDDFSTPNTTNSFGVPASPSNFIKPGKRPQSSMCPSIIVDNDGHVVMVDGASGGTRIITATALTIMNALWFNMTIKEAVDFPRIHHQLYPKWIRVENGFPQYIIDGLKSKGHDIKIYPTASCYVQAILQKVEEKISANCDYRKHGSPDGY